jgi:adenosylhomocysteine nucleosidase
MSSGGYTHTTNIETMNDGLVINGPVGSVDRVDGGGAGRTPHPPRHQPDQTPDEPASRVDVGVLTVLSQETRAVAKAFERTRTSVRRLHDGQPTYEATFHTPGRALTAVLMQTLDRGAPSAAVATANLIQRYRPRVVVLVGIAGGIDPGLDIGDVVIPDQVICYDARRVAPDGIHHRGEATRLPREATLAVNDFFSTLDEPVTLLAPGHRVPFRVVRGSLGSGGAVITDKDAEIRRYLRRFDEKCRIVETEAGGLVQAVREQAPGRHVPASWLVVRGISDHADENKGHRDHDLAAEHAAAAFVELLPFLLPPTAAQPDCK